MQKWLHCNYPICSLTKYMKIDHVSTYVHIHVCISIYSSLYIHINSMVYSRIMLILFKAYHEAIICFLTDLNKQHSSHVAS